MLTPFPIRNDADYERAVELVARLLDVPSGTPEANTLEIMAALVEAHERAHRALPPPDPRKLIAFKLRELGWSQRHLARKLGWGSGRVSEVLSGRRPLTLRMVRQLAGALGIPAGLLVAEVGEEDGRAPWVRVARSLASAAESQGFHGRASLGDLVNDVLAGALGVDTVSRAASVSILVPAPSGEHGGVGGGSPSLISEESAA